MTSVLLLTSVRLLLPTQPSQRPPSLPPALPELCPYTRRQVYRNAPRRVWEGSREPGCRGPIDDAVGRCWPGAPPCGRRGARKGRGEKQGLGSRGTKRVQRQLPAETNTRNVLGPSSPRGLREDCGRIAGARRTWAEGRRRSQRLWATGPGRGASVPWAAEGERPWERRTLWGSVLSPPPLFPAAPGTKADPSHGAERAAWVLLFMVAAGCVYLFTDLFCQSNPALLTGLGRPLGPSALPTNRSAQRNN